ncbi:MAG TPA: hypothetical protein VF803_01425 [Candidatus Paceibacterota bacterium]
MINILPLRTKEFVRTLYYTRFAAVSFFAASFVLVIGACMLVPTYFRASAAEDGLKIQADAIDATMMQSDLPTAAAVGPATLSLQKALSAQRDALRPSQVVDALLSARDATVSLQRIDITTNKTGTAVHISGVATTRDNLLAFKKRLGLVPGVSGVVLPPDALAPAQNAPFGITLSYKRP